MSSGKSSSSSKSSGRKIDTTTTRNKKEENSHCPKCSFRFIHISLVKEEARWKTLNNNTKICKLNSKPNNAYKYKLVRSHIWEEILLIIIILVVPNLTTKGFSSHSYSLTSLLLLPPLSSSSHNTTPFIFIKNIAEYFPTILYSIGLMWVFASHLRPSSQQNIQIKSSTFWIFLRFSSRGYFLNQHNHTN